MKNRRCLADEPSILSGSELHRNEKKKKEKKWSGASLGITFVGLERLPRRGGLSSAGGLSGSAGECPDALYSGDWFAARVRVRVS